MNRSTSVLADLIEERLKPGADVDDVDRRIRSMFGERWCIVFTDMAGFSRRAHRSGIIPFLVLIHQLAKICHPIIRAHGGIVLKTIADSYLLLFRDPKAALRSCLEMQRALHDYNDRTAETDHIYLGCGIGCGEVLKLGDDDVFGIEVNFAAKLGEDLAGPYEIFVTPDALKALGRVAGATFRKVRGSRLGGTKLPYYEVVYELERPTHVRRAKKSRIRFK